MSDSLPAQFLVACLPVVIGAAAGGCRLETDMIVRVPPPFS
jgi:hypothetical protein